MRLPRIPRPHIDLFSGQRAARRWLYAAFVVVLVAFVVLLSANIAGPPHAPSIDTAAAWIALLAVCATVVAIVAAYVELRTLFPRQDLDVRVQRKLVPDWDLDLTQVIFSNATGNALISAYRLEVWLENDRGFTAGYYGEANSSRSGAGAGWNRVFSEEMNYHLFHWVLRRNEPFFPGTEETGPHVDLSDDHGRYTWHVVWHTDRATSDGTLILDVPSSPE